MSLPSVVKSQQLQQLRQQWKEEYCKEWFQFILDNQGQEWRYSYLSSNPNITWEIVENNPQIKWDYYELAENPNITWEIVKNNRQIKWNYFQLSANPMTKPPSHS